MIRYVFNKSHGNCHYLIRDMDDLFNSLFREAIEKERKE